MAGFRYGGGQHFKKNSYWVSGKVPLYLPAKLANKFGTLPDTQYTILLHICT